jgi:hypothetical protein
VTGSAGMQRDRAHERDMITSAARAWKVDGSRIAQLADTRAMDGPVRIEGRDLAWEAIEECADGCNYIAWLMLWIAIYRPTDLDAGEALAHLGHALGAFAYAHEQLQRVRALLAG